MRLLSEILQLEIEFYSQWRGFKLSFDTLINFVALGSQKFQTFSKTLFLAFQEMQFSVKCYFNEIILIINSKFTAFQTTEMYTKIENI